MYIIFLSVPSGISLSFLPAELVYAFIREKQGGLHCWPPSDDTICLAIILTTGIWVLSKITVLEQVCRSNKWEGNQKFLSNPYVCPGLLTRSIEETVSAWQPANQHFQHKKSATAASMFFFRRGLCTLSESHGRKGLNWAASCLPKQK